MVETRLVPPNGDRDPARLRDARGAGGWRAVDVLLDGSISRVAVQRSDFRTSAGRAAMPTPLIASLREKVADLSGGALTDA